MIFLISVSTSFGRERSSKTAGSAAVLRQIIPSRIWRTASYHWARISPLTPAKSWSRLSARSVLQKVNGLLRSPQATRTSLHSCSGQGPSILLRKTVLSLKSPTGAFIALLRCANANFWEYVTFGSVQENTRKTLTKRERAGRCQPSWQGKAQGSLL